MSKRRERQARPTVPEAIDTGLIPHGAAHAPVLLVLTGAQLGQRIRLEQPAVIGRDPEADLMLTDASVAWHHARVEPRDDGWVLVALAEPKERTAVNGERAVERRLVDDDQINVGGVVVRFEVHDPVEQAYDEAVLERLNKDYLTGLLARRKFDAELASALVAAARREETVGVLVLDVDDLKPVNDEHGHLAGAAVIARVGRAIAGELPVPSLACRLGGDEFAVALPGAGLDAARALAEELRACVDATVVEHEALRLRVSVSVGVSAFPAHGDMANALLRSADKAMYRAKRAGGNRVASAEPPE